VKQRCLNLGRAAAGKVRLLPYLELGFVQQLRLSIALVCQQRQLRLLCHAKALVAKFIFIILKTCHFM
jgi:hypothetical protein